MVLVDEMPFNTTLRDNLTFGNPISDDRIYEVFEEIGLMSFLKELQNGLNTIMIPEGKQMSYSVAKKIILARAILKEPKILVLEDPLFQFNANEVGSIMKYLSDESRSWGLVVASNNDSWKEYCSEVIYLENGKQKK